MQTFRIDDVGASTKKYEQYGRKTLTFRGVPIFYMPLANFWFFKRLALFRGWGPYQELQVADWQEILSLFRSYSVKPVIAVTASWVEKDNSLTPFPKKFPEQAAVLKEAFLKDEIVIANHGLTHCIVGQHLPRLCGSNRRSHREFWPELDQKLHNDHVLQSQHILEEYFAKDITVFVPPGNVWSQKTYLALQQTNIKEVHSRLYMMDSNEPMQGIRFVDDSCNLFNFHDRELQLIGLKWLNSRLQELVKSRSSCYSPDLQHQIIDYYRHYYRDICSLNDWRTRTISRLSEEETELKRLNKLRNTFGFNTYAQKHVIVGAGTGGLAVVLARDFGCQVSGVEPDSKALEITKNKLSENSIDSAKFMLEFAEKLPFSDGQFDHAHCFTVLEHVEDINAAIDEMIRVVKPGGCIRVNTPNYSYPYEGHYKIFFPTFMPRFIGYLYLILLGKSPKFLKTINFITSKQLDKILSNKRSIIWFRMFKSYPAPSGVRDILARIFRKLFGYPQQDLFIIRQPD